MHFTKIRVSGFKSFIDPTELPIGPGMTGIVGPNGCGKSNVVEALRWAMGESSAKRMRGGEMDDVIFGGSESRPQRNVAEVMVRIDNTDHTAPAPLRNTDEIEITRRIERGSGSTYRINGKEVRARDVQLLFADLATGANSTALVSQGRVGALIGAKPVERRILLEEAAGIRGLHSRRHEAELRLKAAEGNLERLEDIVNTLEGQYQALQRQVRQATRYRRLGVNIRRYNGMLLHVQWQAAIAEQIKANAKLEKSLETVKKCTALVTSKTTEQMKCEAKLPNLRKAEADSASDFQRLILLCAELDREEERLEQAQVEVKQRLQQITGDIDRERVLKGDAATALDRIKRDLSQALNEKRSETSERLKVQATCDLIKEKLTQKELELTLSTKYEADTKAQRKLLEQRRDDISQRKIRQEKRFNEFRSQREQSENEAKSETDLLQARMEMHESERILEDSKNALKLLETEHSVALKIEDKTRLQLTGAEAELASLEAESKALMELTNLPEGKYFSPLIDSIKVEPGYEIALGAALGDDLNAPANTDAPIHWATFQPVIYTQPLPAKMEALSRYVAGPEVLARRLDQIGIITNKEDGSTLQKKLNPGQRIVSIEGALWRWDGYTSTSDVPTLTATRLAQKNRLNKIKRELELATKNVEEFSNSFRVEKKKTDELSIRQNELRNLVTRSFSELNSAREKHAYITNRIAAANTELERIHSLLRESQSEFNELEKEFKTINSALSNFEEKDKNNVLKTELADEIAALRIEELEKRAELSRLTHMAEVRVTRLASNESDILLWTDRVEGAEKRIAELELRLRTAEADKETLSDRPRDIAQQRSKLLDETSKCEKRRIQSTDELTKAEEALQIADREVRDANSHLSMLREEQIRIQGQVEMATSACEAVSTLIQQDLECEPDQVLKVIEMDSDAVLDVENLELRLDRLRRERDNMGPVNLRAESEAQALNEQIQLMNSEREELYAAISRLRKGIMTLNREGRERLLAAFTSVNDNFQNLFVRLFGGGRAYLTLTEHDDPLESGLEIMASPPGKRLQVLSLLSGGEQALTALALLFAVFLTNPAPICVLDEVDAPLDDANVDRICTLLAEIAESGQVRFLVVTHHRMTMSRVDRLFGVTMGEKGVSQLVSVQLADSNPLKKLL